MKRIRIEERGLNFGPILEEANGFPRCMKKMEFPDFGIVVYSDFFKPDCYHVRKIVTCDAVIFMSGTSYVYMMEGSTTTWYDVVRLFSTWHVHLVRWEDGIGPEICGILNDLFMALSGHTDIADISEIENRLNELGKVIVMDSIEEEAYNEALPLMKAYKRLKEIKV